MKGYCVEFLGLLSWRLSYMYNLRKLSASIVLISRDVSIVLNHGNSPDVCRTILLGM